MKLKIPYFGAGAALLLAGLLLAGCDQQNNDAKHIKVGVINGAEQDVAEVAKKVAKEKYGLEVELVGFSGSLLPNDATNHGELDANVFQHRPFLEQDNKAHGYGVKSMMQMAEQLHGMLTWRQEKQVFTLSVLMQDIGA